jgi:hypothetical protein
MQPRVGSISPIIGPCRGLDRLDHPPSLPPPRSNPLGPYRRIPWPGLTMEYQTVQRTEYTHSVRLSLQSSELGSHPLTRKRVLPPPPLVPGGGGGHILYSLVGEGAEGPYSNDPCIQYYKPSTVQRIRIPTFC